MEYPKEQQKLVRSYRPPIDETPFKNFLADRNAIDELTIARKEGNRSQGWLPQKSRFHLEAIFNEVAPVSDRLIEKNIRQFSFIDSETRKDIVAEQQLKTWRVMAEKFTWERYSDPQRVIGALVNYLKKSTGSFFANRLIEQQRLGDFPTLKPDHPIERPVEDQVIFAEESSAMREAFKQWQESSSELNVAAILGRYQEGKSMQEMAAGEGVGESAIKARINKGKKQLYATVQGLDYQAGLSRCIQLENDTREELLQSRRNVLLERYPAWRELLAEMPKTNQALIHFYGLEGNKPLFNYQQTADLVKISLETARVQIPYAYRLIDGQVNPAPQALARLDEKKLYQAWQANQPEIQLDEIQSTVLNLYYGQGKPHSEISKLLGVGEDTVRRQKTSALNFIRTAQNNRY